MFKLLGIGNSFSDDAFEWIDPILQSLKMEDRSVNNLYIGGCSVSDHVFNMRNDLPKYDYRRFSYKLSSPNMKISEALKLGDWQYITMQQASHDSGMAEAYEYLGELIQRVNELKPQNAKLYWHMTWAYNQNSTHPSFSRYDSDQMKMYKAIVDCVKTKVLKYNDFVKVIPGGTAIQNARSSSLGDNLDRDGFHLSYDLGRYIAAMCVVCTILDIDPETIDFVPHGVDPLRRKIAVESVRNAIANPFDVTQSKL